MSQVIARDVMNSSLAAMLVVDVTVQDYNDHAPEFTSPGGYSVVLYEDQPLNTVFLTVEATDPDQGPNGEVVP